MNEVIVARIRSNPQFSELLAKRGRLGWILSGIMLAIYFAFILTIAFAPQSLAVPLSAGSVVTVGIPVGIVIIVSAFVLTGIYVHKANTEFDRLTNAIKRDALTASKPAPKAPARQTLKEAV